MAVSATPRVDVRSTHVADSIVQPFLQPDFDPVNYLNSNLPSLAVNAGTRLPQSVQLDRSASLPELSVQLQTLLTQLNAQTSRLSNALTQLTDEIIRSGGRLSYGVEVLRGETTGLTDALDNGLRKDIEMFTIGSGNQMDTQQTPNGTTPDGNDRVGSGSNEPEHLAELKTLTAVRERLDSVVKVFDEAMQWPIAPSELSSTSSLISVSAPDAGDDTRSREEKGKAYMDKLRNEINDLIGSGNDMAALEAATARIEKLRQLAEVWKGTAEEKARLKLVESLQKPVEERQRAMEKTNGGPKPATSQTRAVDYRYGNIDPSRTVSEHGYGFLQNLRNLKNDMYIE